MKGKKCFSILVLLLGGLSLLLPYTLLVKNASAIDLSIDVTPTDKHIIVKNLVCFYSDNNYTYYGNGTNYCENPKNITDTNLVITKIRTSQQFELKNGYYYRLLLSVNSGYNAANWLLNGLYTLENAYKIINFKEISEDVFKQYYYCETTTGAIAIQGCATATQLYSGTEYAKYYELIVQSKVNSPQTYFEFGIDGNSMFITQDDPLLLSRIYWYQIDEFKPSNAAEEMNEKDNEDRDNLETQQSESESSAEDSSEDIGSATTNITGIVSTFLGNLQNLNANQCTLPEIAAYGFSLGQLNLCTFQPPSWVQGISSAVVSLMMLGLAIHLFRRIMGIAKGLAGSK